MSVSFAHPLCGSQQGSAAMVKLRDFFLKRIATTTEERPFKLLGLL
jgi:hypothetical protein